MTLFSSCSKKEASVDMHPEKRMKAAFKAFEDKQLPILKAENPNMRLSQLKQMIKKDWMKSPENPMIQHQMAKLNLSWGSWAIAFIWRLNIIKLPYIQNITCV